MPTQTSIVMTLDDIAVFLRVHQSTVYRLLKSHAIPAFKIGSDWRFNRETIEQWISRREAQYLSGEVTPEEGGKGQARRRKSIKRSRPVLKPSEVTQEQARMGIKR